MISIITIRRSLVALLFCAISIPSIASAETVLRVGESVSVAKDQTVENDFYAAAGTIAMSGSIVGDMYVVGGNITANGAVAEDLSALGGSVQVHAPVEDDVRVVGGDVVIAESVGGDVFVIAGSLKILSSASVAGDVFFYGGEAEINGAVDGSIMGAAERFRIDTTVGGDVDVTSSAQLTLGDRASIAGDVQYKSFQELTRAQNAVVEGEIVKSDIERTDDSSGFGSYITAFFMHLFALLVLYLAFRRQLNTFVAHTLSHYGKSGIFGLGALFVAPIVVVLLMVTVLGLFLGLLGLFGFIMIGLLAYVLTATLVAGLLAKIVAKQSSEINLGWLLAGAALLYLVQLIPIIGPFIVFCVFVIALGGIVLQIFHQIRSHG